MNLTEPEMFFATMCAARGETMILLRDVERNELKKVRGIAQEAALLLRSGCSGVQIFFSRTGVQDTLHAEMDRWAQEGEKFLATYDSREVIFFVRREVASVAK